MTLCMGATCTGYFALDIMHWILCTGCYALDQLYLRKVFHRLARLLQAVFRLRTQWAGANSLATAADRSAMLHSVCKL